MARTLKIGKAAATTLGSLTFTGTTLANTTSNQDLGVSGSGTGKLVITAPLKPTNNTASSTSANGAVVVSGGAYIAQDLWVGGALSIGGATGINNAPIGSVTPAAATFTSLTASGTATFKQFAEVIATKTGATGTVVHDFTEANIWYHSSMSASFTMNLTNVPTTNNRSFTVTLILIQGGTPYYASAFQIDGVAQTINWGNWATPAPQANKYEIQTFTLTRVGSAWTVNGSLTSHG
jgi:hypothetical protein